MGLKEKEDGSGSCPPSGLALLLSGGDSDSLAHEVDNVDEEATAAAYVFDVQTSLPRGDGLYSSLSNIVAERAEVECANGSAVDNRPGRLGPTVVEVDYIVGAIETSSSGVLTSTANFSSCRANVCVFSGKWQYETTICSSGIMQIGWATLQCPFTSEEGVGDAPDSYAFDGKRVRKWHVRCTQYGEAWAAGDVIGCCLDLDRGEATFYRNGRSLGVAFTGIRTMQPNLAYFPAVSLSYSERCQLNFGAQPLQYPAPGYQPIQAPPHHGVMMWTTFLVSSLERLVTAVQPQPYSQDGAGGISSKKTAAAAAAAAIVTAEAHRTCVGTRPSFSVPWASWLLMGSIAIDELAQHLLDSHIIASVLMPAMLRLTPSTGSGGPGASSVATVIGSSAGSALPSFLKLLELCLEPEMLSAVVNCVLETLSRRCISAALVPEQFPYSASCPFLALAVAIASRDLLRTTWLRHPNLWQTLEGFLTRKGPSLDDLRQLLPHVWWRGCSELSGDRDRMRGALQALSTAITRVEDKQYELLCCLLGSKGGDPNEDALVEFLRYLVHKNKGATRDMPPPGLSDSTVLISAYFVLVRMLRAALPFIDSFPAGALFVKTAMKADLEPVNSLVRLGGIVTHLCRESPVTSSAELAPLAVAPPSRLAVAPFSSGSLSALPGVTGWGGPSAAMSSPSFPASQLSPPPSCEADSLVVSRVRSCPRLAADLMNLAMTLYASQVGVSVRMTHTMGNTLAGSLAGLEEVERHLRRITVATGVASGLGSAGTGPASSSYATYLRDARDVFRHEVSNNIRFSSLLKVLYFSGWKQEACLSLAGWISRMLIAAAAHSGPLLSYVPTCYLDCILDTLTSVRQASEAVSGTALPPAAQTPSIGALRTHGALSDIIAVLVTLLHEPRICTPDVKEAIVGVLAKLLDQPGMLAEVEGNEVARLRLVGAAVAAFDSRLWHPVSQVLLRLVRGQGFGESRPGQLQLQQQAAMASSSNRGGATLSGSALFRRLLVCELQPERPSLQPFLHRLFNMANWATSEFAATVADLHENRSRRHITEQQQQFRKAGIMFELVSELLRLLEFATNNIPEAFLAAGPHAVLNLNRLLEVVSFVLSHFTEGSDARRLTELLTIPPPDGPGSQLSMSSAVRIERTLLSENINKAQVLAPVVGALLGLWRASGSATAGCVHNTGEADGDAWARADSGRATSGHASGEEKSWSGSSFAASGTRAGLRNLLLDTLLRHWDSHTEKQMEYLRREDWLVALPTAEPELLDAGARDFRELLAGLVARRQQLAACGEGLAGGVCEEAPEELLDPITSSLMMDPVVLPDSQMTVDRSTIERHFLTSQTDPFSRTPLTREALRSNDEIKRKIADWRKSRGRP
ncbi:hypothetical protein VaNZ11_000546 [Volvox africanus]|uniref:RING-type E3 ubiquitin transferase n=1 Tax=Volvox africanus TaxID=51714 RepID=A0ABQ5RMI5_9CHLO|nr:hypothetical protein VaNZ11_000546 [Volvox africanus]